MSEVVQIFLEALSTVRVAPTSQQGLVLLSGGYWFQCTLPFFLLSVVSSSSEFSGASLKFPNPLLLGFGARFKFCVPLKWLDSSFGVPLIVCSS